MTPLHLLLIYAARAVRGFGDGFAVILLPAYLSAIGFDPVEIGIVASGLAARHRRCSRSLVGFVAPRHDLRNLLLAGAGLMVATGLVLSERRGHAPSSSVVAFVGTINPSTGDLGMLVPLEHAMLARDVADRDRTRVFARYSLIGALSTAAGALAAALAGSARRRRHRPGSTRSS